MQHLIIFLYNSYKDPLCQGLLLSYVNEIAKDGIYTFHIISYEQEKYKLSEEAIALEKLNLIENNIHWYPLTFHTGRFLLAKKGFDCIRGISLAIKLRFKYKIKAIVAFANIAGAFSYIAAKISDMKLIVFSYEPHSEFLLELGYWKKDSLKFKLLNKLEYLLGVHEDYIITGTKYMVERLMHWRSNAKIFRLPTSVDTQRFSYSDHYRSQIRKQLQLCDKYVVIYTGKFGDLYYKDEIFELARALYEFDNRFFFLFLTAHEKNEVESWFNEYKIPNSSYLVKRVPLNEVSKYLSAADIGLVTVANFPSKKFCSPTKVGEYLCNGVPYIVTEGTSEDDLYATANKVGVVVKSFHKTDIIEKISDIMMLLNEEKSRQRARCHSVGVEYRGSEHAVRLFKNIFKEVSA